MNAILLDALGTLVALEPPAPRLRRELATRFGVDVSGPEAQLAIGTEIAYYRAHLGDGRDQASLRDLRSRCSQVLRASLPASGRLAAVGADALTEALLAALEFRPFEDVRPALTAASARGLRLVCVSNWDVSLHDVLERLALTPLLDGVVTSAEVGHAKPAPAVFERALQIAQAAPDRAIHVGDSVEEDVVGAQRAGIEPVFLSRDGRAAPEGVRVITTLLELEVGP